MQYTLNQTQIGSFKAIDLYSLTHWKSSTASIQLRYHNKDLFLLNRRRLPRWRPMSHAWTKTERPWRSPWMRRRTAAPNWSLGDGPLTETFRGSSWSWMTRRPRTRWGVDPASVWEVYPASIYQRGGSIFFVKRRIQFFVRDGSILCEGVDPAFVQEMDLSSIWCMDIRFPVLVLVGVLLII